MSTNYSITRDMIVSSALRKLQVIELGITPDASTLSNAAQALNVVIKSWQTQGIKLWTVENYVIPLTATKNAYVISPSGPDLVQDKPLKVIQAWMRNIGVTPNIDTPLLPISRQEYNVLGSKNSSGMVNSYWYEPGTISGTVTVFLTPDTSTATNYQLYLVGQRPLNDILLSTDIPDFPNEWMQALVWGLADELAIEYGVNTNVRNEISMKANKYRTELEGWDVENASTYFTPDMRMSRG